MISGDPYKFAVGIDVVSAWNDSSSAWQNGLFCMYLNGIAYPEPCTSTLNSELPALLNSIDSQGVPIINNSLFLENKEIVVDALLRATFPEDYHKANDNRFCISSYTMLDQGIYVFALGNGSMVRVIVAKGISDYENSKKDFDISAIDEVIISTAEFHNVIEGMRKFCNPTFEKSEKAEN